MNISNSGKIVHCDWDRSHVHAKFCKKHVYIHSLFHPITKGKNLRTTGGKRATIFVTVDR